jgi:hypothetical protein
MAAGSTALLVCAALAAGAAGAGTVLLVAAPAPAPVPPAAAPPADLLARIEKQDRELADLRSRLEEFREARGPGRRPPGAGPGAPILVATGEGEVQAFVPGSPPHPESPGATSPEPGADLPPDERARFETYYRQMREKEQADGRKARAVLLETQLRARLDRLQGPLALSAEQKDTAVRLLTERAERTRAAYEEARVAGTPDAVRAAQERVAALREETKTSLLQSLTVEQVRAVEQAERGGGIPGRTTGGGGGRRQGGDPGRGGCRLPAASLRGSRAPAGRRRIGSADPCRSTSSGSTPPTTPPPSSCGTASPSSPWRRSGSRA